MLAIVTTIRLGRGGGKGTALRSRNDKIVLLTCPDVAECMINLNPAKATGRRHFGKSEASGARIACCFNPLRRVLRQLQKLKLNGNGSRRIPKLNLCGNCDAGAGEFCRQHHEVHGREKAPLLTSQDRGPSYLKQSIASMAKVHDDVSGIGSVISRSCSHGACGNLDPVPSG